MMLKMSNHGRLTIASFENLPQSIARRPSCTGAHLYRSFSECICISPTRDIFFENAIKCTNPNECRPRMKPNGCVYTFANDMTPTWSNIIRKWINTMDWLVPHDQCVQYKLQMHRWLLLLFAAKNDFSATECTGMTHVPQTTTKFVYHNVISKCASTEMAKC